MSKLLMKLGLQTILILFLSSIWCNAEEQDVSTSTIEVLEHKLELDKHKQLGAIKDSSIAVLSDFKTDGCSGGLSVGWAFLAGKIENIQSTHGTHPPWESCCVDHDILYHEAGGRDVTAVESFELRKEADNILKMCVLQTGIERAPELTAKYNLSDQEIDFLYKSISSLMYHAVRLGGVPCSGLPWRWGYGWPECD